LGQEEIHIDAKYGQKRKGQRMSKRMIHTLRKAGQDIRRPTKAELAAATSRVVPDVIAHDLQVLFCGINPGLYSAWAGHHFARPGNRFWPALFASGFTNRLLRPEEENDLLAGSCGITNLVERATIGSQELGREELREGGKVFQNKVLEFQPKAAAILGVAAYRTAFDHPKAVVGPQRERIGESLVWVLPNPSGLNAHFTPPALAKLFRKFRLALAND
jgi:TDG/mug DNA glycosylase family protein